MASKSIPPEKELIQIFQALAGQNEKLSLTRSYHGLSLKQGAAVTKVEDGKIFLKVCDAPILAGLDGPIYIQHKSITRLVRGSFHIDNLATGIGALSNVSWIGRKWRKRTHDRVQPKNTVHIEIEYQNQSMRGNLDNISTSGMAVFINKSFTALINLDLSSKAQFNFRLTPACDIKTLGGTIVYLQPVSSKLTRLGVKFNLNFEELARLQAYIASRKAEILAELNQDYLNSDTRNQVSNLYF
jgi:hypothetical protein